VSLFGHAYLRTKWPKSEVQSEELSVSPESKAILAARLDMGTVLDVTC
jgi:hypothetical protein